MANLFEKIKSSLSGKSSGIKLFFARVFIGALIGTGAVLPGVSGGAMSAAFGVYRPMMEVFANPKKTWRKHIGLLIPIGVGLAIGFIALANLVEWLLRVSEAPVIAFFIGCIIATLPALFKEADRINWTRGNWITLAGSVIVSTAILISMEIMQGGKVDLTPEPGTLAAFITWTICGLVFALGSIIPGMSPSQILLYVGLYEPMMGGIGRLDMAVFLPVVLGAALCVVMFTKLVAWLFEKGSRTMYAIIIGIVIGSTIMIFPREWPGFPPFLVSLLSFAGGIVVVWLSSKLEAYKETEQE
ncbi:MAG: DUF368 domain-containing protein [Oscillospiraceae bacterium]|nr:DUF368 domain-containing protein [Oscillospiraceae bacterium]